MSGIFSIGHNDEAVMHGEFMGFVLDDESLLSLRGWTERQGYPRATAQQGGPDMFAQLLESSPPPKMAIIDIDQQADPAAVTARIINLCGGDCRLVVVGSKNDVSLYRRILSAGAIDYLVKPLSPDLLNQALASALRGPTGGNKQESKEARIVVFVGARGGIGTSTIALNTGWIIAHELNLHVALFDLDLQFGTSSLALDLDPGHGLRDIVSSPNRVDALMIASRAGKRIFFDSWRGRSCGRSYAHRRRRDFRFAERNEKQLRCHRRRYAPPRYRDPEKAFGRSAGDCRCIGSYSSGDSRHVKNQKRVKSSWMCGTYINRHFARRRLGRRTGHARPF